MSTIILPPLPAPETWDKRYTPDQLRARDLEIARLVLEEAAVLADKYGNGAYLIAQEIRALEVRHAE